MAILERAFHINIYIDVLPEPVAQRFLAITSWVEAGSAENRSQQIEDLLSTIAEPNLSNDFIMKQFHDNGLILTDSITRH